MNKSTFNIFVPYSPSIGVGWHQVFVKYNPARELLRLGINPIMNHARSATAMGGTLLLIILFHFWNR
jgi:hypothetical protein